MEGAAPPRAPSTPSSSSSSSDQRFQSTHPVRRDSSIGPCGGERRWRVSPQRTDRVGHLQLPRLRAPSDGWERHRCCKPTKVKHIQKKTHACVCAVPVSRSHHSHNQALFAIAINGFSQPAWRGTKKKKEGWDFGTEPSRTGRARSSTPIEVSSKF